MFISSNAPTTHTIPAARIILIEELINIITQKKVPDIQS